MKAIKKLKLKGDDWFYSPPSIWLRFLSLSFVKGDLILLLPFVCLLFLLAFFSWRLSLLFFLLYFSLRHFGEMIYWLLKQMGDKKYRPSDFGFRNFSNEAIYILYQLISLVKTVIFLGFLIIFLKGR